MTSNNETSKKSNKQHPPKNAHAFSEALSDGGVRDKTIKRQSSKSCGGL